MLLPAPNYFTQLDRSRQAAIDYLYYLQFINTH